MKRRKKFQWRMAALVTAVAMTCMMMTACSLGDLHKLNDKVIVELDGWNWTSSEYDWRNAVAVSLDFVDGVSSAGFQYNHKGEAKYHVRPVFAM